MGEKWSSLTWLERKMKGQVWLDHCHLICELALSGLIMMCHLIQASTCVCHLMREIKSCDSWYPMEVYNLFSMWPVTLTHCVSFIWFFVTSFFFLKISTSLPLLLWPNLTKVLAHLCVRFLHLLLMWIHIEEYLLWYSRDPANLGRARLREGLRIKGNLFIL